MSADPGNALISRVNRTHAAAIGVLASLIAGGFMAAASTAGAARSEQTATVSVNRINNSDRLPIASKFIPNVSSPLVSTLPWPPIGCDAAFSRAAEPARAHIFGRCVS